MRYKAQKTITIFVCFFLVITVKSLANAPLDSIGIEKQGNKIFILHKVDAKETLYSLSRRYNVKTDQIQQENPELKEGLKIGQILRIPYEPKATVAVQKANSAEKGVKTHTVSAGQTLYSISREYNVTIDNIKKWNNLTSNELDLNQEIIVGMASSNEKPLPSKPQETVITEKVEVSNLPNFKYDSRGNKIHVAQPGQTLYSIAQTYNTTPETLKNWNNLASNEISSGQEIVVEKVKSKEVAEVVENNQEGKNNTPQNTVAANNQSTEINRPVIHSPEPVKSTKTSSGFNKIIDRGLAEAIEESGDNPKFLALHKTASVGTIIQVKNELNNLYIFARVIGKLPNTGENDRLVIKLSKKAYDKLGAVDKRFPVEVSYVPND
ncbi:MAG TPA: LysM peptidoglycan-binding domain-containing protein [Cytophagales bacterium]|nr:LysM peptidoglycan-binding domain-containing protein [Cytophagales bacterium]